MTLAQNSLEEPLARSSEPGSRRGLARRALLYAIGPAAYKIVSFLLLPLVARGLGAASLGILDLAAVLGAFLAVLVSGGADNAVARLISQNLPAPRAWGAAFTMTASLSVALLCVVLVIVAFGPTLPNGFSVDLLIATTFYGISLATVSHALNAVRLRGSPRAYGKVAFVLLAAELAATVALALAVKAPLVIVVLGWAASNALGSALVIRRYIKGIAVPSRAEVRQLAALAAPIVPGLAIWIIGDMFIRSAVAEHSASLLGAYSFGMRIAAPLGLAVAGLSAAWPVLLFSRRDNLARSQTASTAVPVVGVLACGVLSLSLGADAVIAVLGGDGYIAARDVVGQLALGQVMIGLIALLSGLAFVFRRTHAVALAASVGTAVQVGSASLISGAERPLVVAGCASAAGFIAAVIVLGVALGMPLRFWTLAVVPAMAAGAVGTWVSTSSGTAGVAHVMVASALAAGYVAILIAYWSRGVGAAGGEVLALLRRIIRDSPRRKGRGGDA